LSAVQDQGSECLSYLASVLWHLGYPDQALQHIAQALALAQQHSHPLSITRAHSFYAGIHTYRQERRAAQEQAEMVMTLAAEHGFPFWRARGVISRGWALGEKSQIEQIRQGLRAYNATGAQAGQLHYLVWLADTCREAGQIEEGLQTLAEAVNFMQTMEERSYEPEVYRLKGELLLQQEKQKAKGKK
jgi:tetratricopeptide (TPR) repeat protein